MNTFTRTALLLLLFAAAGIVVSGCAALGGKREPNVSPLMQCANACSEGRMLQYMQCKCKGDQE